jgi:hypothetical protein
MWIIVGGLIGWGVVTYLPRRWHLSQRIVVAVIVAAAFLAAVPWAFVHAVAPERSPRSTIGVATD